MSRTTCSRGRPPTPSRSPSRSSARGSSHQRDGDAGSERHRRGRPLILALIRELAEYERLAHEVIATEEGLRGWLFGERQVAEALIGELDGHPVAFALFFHNFSTFLGKPGIYLEDLYVRPRFRGRGMGKAMMVRLARLARERGCGRLEWSVLDWNEPSIGFYESLGALAMTGWTVHRLTGEALDGLSEGTETDA